ncbi:ATP-dependent DNA ligase [Pilimelia terevasa]|uniref:DNA ligase (ATP) n=2 Tax=Pilimelia terevasa TaxID=53372 RepID=A0A8J3BLP3_9ACTN|nr:ATP-dependent DNA ligase [Pilimelia terevasa]
MLATTGSMPVGAQWAYEFKWDGVRAIAHAAEGRLRLYARGGAEITAAYPELAPLAAALPPDTVLDGEVVALDTAGVPSFVALAERMHVRDPARAAALAATRPVTYMIFDVPRLAGEDVSGRPYDARRALLDALAPAGPHWVAPPSFGDGAATAAAARAHGLEGLVAKRRDAPYRPGGRTGDWVKLKWHTSDDFVVGGWRPGARRIGALLLGAPGAGGLSYRGRCGGGISAAAERDLLAHLVPGGADPFADLPAADARGARWAVPSVVVEVRYAHRTPDGRLRFPCFLRRRPDRTPADLAAGEAG